MKPFVRYLTVWTFVCMVSAAPSFVFALRETWNVAGMCVGVAIFILGYALISCTETVQQIRSRPFVHRTLCIGYGMRMALSLLAPYGGFVFDLVLGGVSTVVAREFFAEPKQFAGTLTTTLIQGALINLLLAVFMGVLYVLQRLCCRPPIPEGCCEQCGYNLTGLPEARCPECGTAFSPEVPTTSTPT